MHQIDWQLEAFRPEFQPTHDDDVEGLNVGQEPSFGRHMQPGFSYHNCRVGFHRRGLPQPYRGQGMAGLVMSHSVQQVPPELCYGRYQDDEK
jgi:hypothetical protein